MKTPKRADGSSSESRLGVAIDAPELMPLRLFRIRYIGPTGIESHDVMCHFIQCLGEATMNFYEVTIDVAGREHQMLRFGVRNWIDVVEMDTIKTGQIH